MTETGIWSQQEADKYHQDSPKFAGWLGSYLNPEEFVIDFGCGTGYYIGELEKHGFNGLGIDGCMQIKPKCSKFATFDLTQPLTNLVNKGSVISLEVGEHLPKWAEQTFLDTITSHCTYDLIISWALPNQPGIGHVNCRPQEYIISEVERRGFIYQPATTQSARMHVDKNCDWFERTLLVFIRKPE